MNFPDDYKPLFYSLMVLFSCYLLFLAFYVNEKARVINEKEKRAKRKTPSGSRAPESFVAERDRLIKTSVKFMIYMLITDTIINGILIFLNHYYQWQGIVGGILFPLLLFAVFVFLLAVAIGLKGQRVLNTGKFFKGLD